MREIKVGDVTETVVERSDYPPDKIRAVLGGETVAVLGYGVQGRGQSLNMKDNGVSVIVGQREKTKSWDTAAGDGWVPGKTLFPLEEAARRGTVVQYLLSDAGQKEFWPKLKPYLTAGKALYFSHGFSIVYRDQTGVVPSKDLDVILVAPKGSGTTVRRLFLEGRGINASFAVHQDATGRARDRGRRDAPRPGDEQPQGLPRAAREGAQGDRRERDVEGGHGRALAAAGTGGEVEGVRRKRLTRRCKDARSADPACQIISSAG